MILRLSPRVARIELRPVLERFQGRQIGRPLGIVKLCAAQPAPLEAIPKQDGVHLPRELIDLPYSIALDRLTCRIEQQAVEPAKRVDFRPNEHECRCPPGRRDTAGQRASAARHRAGKSPDAAS